MSYDNWLQPPDPTFGVCLYCHASEEDHVPVKWEVGDNKPEERTVCPEVADLAMAIEEDYPFELVYPDDVDDTDNALILAYEDACEWVSNNEYEEDDGDY